MNKKRRTRTLASIPKKSLGPKSMAVLRVAEDPRLSHGLNQQSKKRTIFNSAQYKKKQKYLEELADPSRKRAHTGVEPEKSKYKGASNGIEGFVGQSSQEGEMGLPVSNNPDNIVINPFQYIPRTEVSHSMQKTTQIPELPEAENQMFRPASHQFNSLIQPRTINSLMQPPRNSHKKGTSALKQEPPPRSPEVDSDRYIDFTNAQSLYPKQHRNLPAESNIQLKKRRPSTSRNQDNKTVSKFPQQIESADLSLVTWFNMQIMADEQRETRIQNEFYKIDIPQLLRSKTILMPQLTIREIPTIHTFEVHELPQLPQKSQLKSTNVIINAVENLCFILGIEFNHFEVVIKKYHNCVLLHDKERHETLIWYDDGRLYCGGWKGDTPSSDNGQDCCGNKEGLALEYSSTYWFKGHFHQGQRDGSGIMLMSNGDKYEGQWKQGKRHGQGIFYCKKKSEYYIGKWKDNFKEGKGAIIYEKEPDRYFEGTFSKSRKCGFGQELFKNGDVYQGNYKDDGFDGEGKYFWKTGQFFRGEFAKGLRTGIGLWITHEPLTITHPIKQTKIIYYGEYIENKRCGFGIEYFLDGTLFKGYFYQNRRNGPGISRKLKPSNKIGSDYEHFNSEDSIVFKGVWKLGELFKIDDDLD